MRHKEIKEFGLIAIFIGLDVFLAVYQSIALLILATFIGTIFIRPIIDQYKEKIVSSKFWIVSSDARKYIKERNLIVKNKSTVLDSELAKLLHHRGIIETERRIKVGFEDLCIKYAIRVDKFFQINQICEKIAGNLALKFSTADFDVIMMGETGANEILRAYVEKKFFKEVFTYRVDRNGGVELNLSEDLNAFKGKNNIRVLVVESAVLSPRIIHRLSSGLHSLSARQDIDFHIVGLSVAFDSYKGNYAIDNIKKLSLIKLNNEAIPSCNCLACHDGSCIDYERNPSCSAVYEQLRKSYLLPTVS